MVGVHLPDTSQGANTVGNIIGAVHEGHTTGSDNLHVLEHILSAGVEHLSICMQLGHPGIIQSCDMGMHIIGHGRDEVLDPSPLSKPGAVEPLQPLLCLRRLLHHLHLLLGSSTSCNMGSLSILLHVLLMNLSILTHHLLAQPHGIGCGNECSTSTYNNCHPRLLVIIPRQLLLADTLQEDGQDDNEDGAQHNEGDEVEGDLIGVRTAEHSMPGDEEDS
mmetsp:Transcript_26606/g.71958  ORF Transcript_26606/g.71958 Transcript_26606/m.71958 type:complete len:219 (-) Transcript_26606:728-1384(-)